MKKWTPQTVFLMASGLLIITAAGLSLWFWSQIQTGGLPRAITAKVSFPVYYYAYDRPPGNFTLDPASVHAQNDMLFFDLKDGKRLVGVTEQALPPDLKNSTVKGNKAVDGADGSATISTNGAKTIGYYVSRDKKTFVILNGDGIDTTTMEDLVRLLKQQ